MSRIIAENWLADRLQQHGVDIYIDGVFDSYRERLRKVIADNGLAQSFAGRRDNKLETYAQVFERIYGEALIVPRGTNQTTSKGPL